MNQAWLITRVDIENHKVVDTFVALLDANIPSEAIRRITEELHYVLLDSPAHSLSRKPDNAQYRILNDGTSHTGEIFCGDDPGIYARRVYDISITPDINQLHILNWREAHIFMQDNVPSIEYWEDFSVTIPLTGPNNADN